MAKLSLEGVFKQVNSVRIATTKAVSKAKNVKSTIHYAEQSIMNMLFATGYSVSDPVVVKDLQQGVARSIELQHMKYINKLAMADKKKYWHVYEPGRHGQTRYKLFNMTVADKQYKSNMRMDLNFAPSKMMTIVHPTLAKPGKTGKYVKRRHKFVNKALTVEYGRTVKIKPKKPKGRLAILSPDKSRVLFTMKTIKINWSNKSSFMALNDATATFFETRAPDIALNHYDRQARKVRAQASRAAISNIKVNRPSDTRAKQIGRQYAKAMKAGIL